MVAVEHATKGGWRKMTDSKSRGSKKQLRGTRRAGRRQRNQQSSDSRSGTAGVWKNILKHHVHISIWETQKHIWLLESKLQEIQHNIWAARELQKPGRLATKGTPREGLTVPPQACNLHAESRGAQVQRAGYTGYTDTGLHSTCKSRTLSVKLETENT